MRTAFSRKRRTRRSWTWPTSRRTGRPNSRRHSSPNCSRASTHSTKTRCGNKNSPWKRHRREPWSRRQWCRRSCLTCRRSRRDLRAMMTGRRRRRTAVDVGAGGTVTRGVNGSSSWRRPSAMTSLGISRAAMPASR
ncbi:MAG: hypothetical protein WC483_03895 [Candidatus Paceibacterota bacterium]